MSEKPYVRKIARPRTVDYLVSYIAQGYLAEQEWMDTGDEDFHKAMCLAESKVKVGLTQLEFERT